MVFVSKFISYVRAVWKNDDDKSFSWRSYIFKDHLKWWTASKSVIIHPFQHYYLRTLRTWCVAPFKSKIDSSLWSFHCVRKKKNLNTFHGKCEVITNKTMNNESKLTMITSKLNGCKGQWMKWNESIPLLFWIPFLLNTIQLIDSRLCFNTRANWIRIKTYLNENTLMVFKQFKRE